MAPMPREGSSARLDAHLAGWERAIAGVKSLRCDLTLTRKDFGGESSYTGSLLAMRPNYLRLRLDSRADPKDYEAFIGDGKSLFAYNGLQRTVAEHKPDSWFFSILSRNILIDLLRGMTVRALKARFEVHLFKEDANYLYLEIKPLHENEKQDLRLLRVALYQPTHSELAYLPAQVYLLRPSGDTEQWKLSNLTTNLLAISEVSFQFEQIRGFRFLRAPESRLTPAPEPRPLLRRPKHDK
jgi:TIGR03009 family protein